MPPKVSIITPLHNKGAYVAETIQSVRSQTMTDWEMIIVENGSTDNGEEVVLNFSDPRIQLVHSPQYGPGAARNFGLDLALGEWVLFLDADDMLDSDYLAARLASAHVHNVKIIAGGWKEFSDGTFGDISSRCPAGWGQGSVQVLDSAIGAAPWIVHAALVRRSWLKSDRRWPEALDRLPSEDAAFWFRVIHCSEIAWSRHNGALYRLSTPTSRDLCSQVDNRARAVSAVIEHNLQFLDSHGLMPSPGQCRTLMRVFEDTYRRTMSEKAEASARAALKNAETWLRQCPADSLSISFRKLLGLRLFNIIRFGVI